MYLHSRLPGKRKKKLPGFRDNNIPNHCMGEKRKKNSFGKKNKEKANFVTPVEKNQEMQSVGQKNKNPP